MTVGRAFDEVARGERFAFGRNWRKYVDVLDEPAVALAIDALCTMLDVRTLAGKRFLDIGCGSGVHSLAALRLGATVRSFDYDPESVEATELVRARFAPDVADERWKVERGSVLDERFIDGLGRFDVVYAWGVLHHTGDLWRALELAGRPVAPGGRLFVAVYNDEGKRSDRWRNIKRIYCSGVAGRAAMSLLFLPYLIAYDAKESFQRGENPLKRVYGRRGMTTLRDVVDWLGGYPFEVARPESVVRFCRERGFVCDRLTTGAGSGCNEFVFTRADLARPGQAAE